MPKTPEGKAKSARNATKHGVLSNEPLLVNENPACYEELLHAHIERFLPADEVELEIVHEMAFAKWRQRRAWNNETAMIDMQMHEEQEILKAKFEKFDEATRIAHAVGTLSDESSKLRANSRYETRFHRMYYRAMNQLLALQDRRKRDTPPNDQNRVPSSNGRPGAPNDKNRGHSGPKPNESLTDQVAVSPIFLSSNAAPLDPPNDKNRGHSGHKPNESLTEPATAAPIPAAPNHAPAPVASPASRDRKGANVNTTSIANPPLREKPKLPNELRPPTPEAESVYPILEGPCY